MRRWLVIGVVTAVLLAIGVFAISQALAQPAQQQRQQQGQARMFMPMMGGGAVAANDKYVYVIWMGTLYQFDAGTLKQLNTVELPRPQMPQFGPGGGQFGPGGGQFGPGGGQFGPGPQ